MPRKKSVFSDRFLNSLFNRPYGVNLYFITDGQYVKIGSANDVYKRLKQLQTGNPRPLWILAEFKDYGEKEAWVHDCLKDYRQNGEWYYLNDNVKSFISSLMKERKIVK